MTGVVSRKRYECLGIERNPREVYLPRGWPQTPDSHGYGVQTGAPEEAQHRVVGGRTKLESSSHQAGVVRVLELVSYLQPAGTFC